MESADKFPVSWVEPFYAADSSNYSFKTIMIT